MESGFGTVAAYYEVLSNSEARLTREGPFLRACLESAPGMRVADIACGTGLHAWFFAELGAEVVARDLSGEMIEYARKNRAHPHVTYEMGDMRDVGNGPYDAVFCLGNSVCLLPGAEDVERVFASVSSALSPGGRFVVQILNYASQANGKPRHRVDEKRRGETEIVAVKSLVPKGDRTFLSLAFFASERGGTASVSEASVLMNLTLEQVSTAAQRSGLSVLGAYGSFDRSEYVPDSSPDLICIFAKAAG